MNVPFVDLYAQYTTIKSEIEAAIAAVIQNSAYVRGPFVEKFEQEFAQELGLQHCVSCANGTDALYIAMKALGLRQGDEVITTAHSWISTAETITQAGGRVVFCDTDRESFNIDPTAIEAKINERTKGIVAVHLYGQPADMDAIMHLKKKYNLWLIEDCAQAHFARYKDRMVGTFGDVATFSFYPGKNLGAMGDAGCLVTNHSDLAKWSALFARHGGKGEHVIEGINSRLDGLQAAILSVKLKHIHAWTKKRQEIAARYDQLLTGVGDIIVPKRLPDRSHVYHLYVIRSARRDSLSKVLTEKKVGTSLNYPIALPFLQAYRYLGHKRDDFPVAHSNQNRILSIPIYPELSPSLQSYVVEAIQSCF